MPSSRPLTMAMRRAWARTRIHLDLGDFPAAVQAAREASELTGADWERLGQPFRVSRAGIYTSLEMPLGWCWFEPDRWRVLLSPTTLYEFGWNEHMYRFVDTVFPESTFRTYSPDAWHALSAGDDIEIALHPERFPDRD